MQGTFNTVTFNRSLMAPGSFGGTVSFMSEGRLLLPSESLPRNTASLIIADENYDCINKNVFSEDKCGMLVLYRRMRKRNGASRNKQHYNYIKPLCGLVRHRNTGKTMEKLHLFHVPRAGGRQKIRQL